MDTNKYLKNLNVLSKHETEFHKKSELLSLMELRVLDLVFDGPMCLKEISKQRCAAPQSIGRVCSRLQERGVLNIELLERDKRTKMVSLTPVGLALHGKGMEALEDIIAAY
jgi:DNA-binding MarR family transcriptional regulator